MIEDQSKTAHKMRQTKIAIDRIGIFGGTFDPIHNGHLAIAEAALRLMNLKQIMWVPVSRPAHKTAITRATFEQRRSMVEKAIADYPEFVLVVPESASYYAVDTLAQLQQTYPNKHWYWIIGLDSFLTLPKWYQHQRLCEAVEWIVAPRHSTTFAVSEIEKTKQLCSQIANRVATEAKPVRWKILNSPLIDISSTMIRRRCFLGQEIDQLVPETIKTYIENQKLYTREFV